MKKTSQCNRCKEVLLKESCTCVLYTYRFEGSGIDDDWIPIWVKGGPQTAATKVAENDHMDDVGSAEDYAATVVIKDSMGHEGRFYTSGATVTVFYAKELSNGKV